MKAIRWAALPAAVAMIAMVPTAPAMAAAKKLVLSASGTAVANGSPASVGVLIDGCSIWSNGTVVANEAAKDVLSGTTSSEAECAEAGTTISGLITETQLGKTGKASLKGTIVVTLPESCAYAFKNPKGTFTIPGIAGPSGVAKGKLVKGSSKSCAKTNEQSFFASATNEAFEEPFNATLS